jgi:FG-GAP-like repeat
MNIVISYDQPTGALPSGFTMAVSAVATFYGAQFTDNITFNLHVGYGEVHGSALGSGTLGASFYFLNQYSYSQIRNALLADAKSVDDSTGLGNVPAGDPIGGTHQYWVAQVQAKALGLLSDATVIDQYVGFSNTFTFDYDRSNGITAGQYDFYGTVAHEIAEVMGKNLLVGGTIGSTTNSYVPSDLFHYSASGVRDFSGTTPGYFSIDGGATNLNNFNTNPSGDFGDWASSAGNDSWRAFSDSGVINAVTETDLRFLDVIGFDLAGAPSGFASPAFQLSAFGTSAGGWSSDDTYPRDVADVNGGGMADIVGFSSAGVYESLATGGGHFAMPTFELAAFGVDAGGWSSDNTYPRKLADVDGGGMADIVGFSSAGVYESLASAGGHFAMPTFELAAFGTMAGGWSSDNTYPRELADVNLDGRADIIGFSSAGVYESLATAGGHFAMPTFELAAFGTMAGGWSSNDTYPRKLADVNGDGRADIVGFGADGVYVSLATTGGHFAMPTFELRCKGRHRRIWLYWRMELCVRRERINDGG